MYGFEATADDLEVVLRVNFLRLKTVEEIAFEALAERLLPTINQARVEKEALKHANDLEGQTQAAHREIEVQLVESGVLEAIDLRHENWTEEGDGEAPVTQVLVQLAITFVPAGTPVADIVSALERNVASAISMGMLTGDGPATVSEYSVSVQAKDEVERAAFAEAVG